MVYDIKAAEERIRKGAAARGMDPATAVRVARSEGLAPGVYQSALGKNGRREPSYGPFQLLVGGEGTGYGRGLGNAFMQQTGLDPRDPSTVNAQIDFALDRAKAGGWSPWYGAAKAGIGKWDGIRRSPPQRDDSENVASSTNDTDFSQELPMSGSRATAGGLGGLGGMPVEPEPEGVTGFLGSQGFGDWLSAMGTSLMSSPSNNPLAGFSDALASRQTLRQRQEAIENDRAEKANDRGAMEMALRNAGVPADQARALSANASAANLAIQQLERDRVVTRSNLTAERLRDRHPDLAAAIDDGSMLGVDAAKEAYRRDEDARKPPSLQEIYTEDGGSQKGYFRDGEWHSMGGTKKPSQSAGGTNAPAGFRFTDDAHTNLEPIPGGPGEQIAGELAARIGLTNQFLKDAPALRERLANGEASGPVDVFMARNSQNSTAAEVQRRLEFGVEAMVRMLTGAGMNMAEAEERTRRYLPTYTDDADSMVAKLDDLTSNLTATRDAAMRGRGGVTSPPKADLTTMSDAELEALANGR